MRAWLGSTLVILVLLASSMVVRADDLPVVGKRLAITDKIASKGKASATLSISDPSLTKGAATNPADISASLKLSYAGNVGMFLMPAGAGWTKNDAKLASFTNKTAPTGGNVNGATLRPGKSVSVRAKGLGDVPIDISVPPTGPVDVTYAVVNGGQEYRFCTKFTTCKHTVLKKNAGYTLVCTDAVGDGTCAAVQCGDGVVDAGETCDDGNTAPGDGCDASCRIEYAYAWATGDYTACSVTCGDGVQSRAVWCEQNPGATLVSDLLCTDAGPRPVSQQTCNDQACATPSPSATPVPTPTATAGPTPAFVWVQGGFGTCSASCGGGTQTQSVTCLSLATNATVPDSNCSAISPKPATSQSCNTTACPTPSPSPSPTPAFVWVQGGFGTCSASCGGGTQTQSVTCLSLATNATVPDSNCSAISPKPATSQSCNTQACPTYAWVASGFGTCSTTCGNGIQTQTVTCRDTTTNTVVADTFCSALVKPATLQTCNLQACPTASPTPAPTPAFTWVTGTFSPCSTTCGDGIQTRSVTCLSLATNATVADSNCSAISPKPATLQTCNVQACPTASPSPSPTPSFAWVTGSFGACSASCGGGFQTRTVTCFSFATSSTVADANCTALSPKPVTLQSCNTNPC